jgi:hypothetical protein
VTDLLQTLQEFYRDKLTLLLRHQAGAKVVGQYDVNNTYQYIINRDEAHLAWVGKAIADLGASPPEQAEIGRSIGGRGADASRSVIDADAQDAQAFVDRWRPRLDHMTNARHAKMLRVILGEALEQKRSFEQALAGRTDLLGRRGEQLGPSHGEVLPTRWIE